MTAALVLSGGGARGAYQAGVLKGIATFSEIKKFPFKIITGISAGAINASFIASSCDDFLGATRQLADFWSNLKTPDIYRTDISSLSHLGFHWALDLLFGGTRKNILTNCLLDAAPLRKLLEKKINFPRIATMIDTGFLDTLEISATDYLSTENVSFYMSRNPGIAWKRAGRKSERTQILLEHVLASSAIPLFFSPVDVNGRPFGDGCLRNSAPLSPAIKLGADKILLINVRKKAPFSVVAPNLNVNIGRILGVLMNAILLESTEQDLERIVAINSLLKQIEGQQHHHYRIIENLVLRPSQDIGELAKTMYEDMPPLLRYLLRGLGSEGQTAEIVSYLLFEPAYCRYLVESGYKDTLERRDEVLEFLKS